MKWPDIDPRLGALGKDRRWLADQTPYTYDTIRNTLAPKATKRSARMLSVLARAIEDEEDRRRASGAREVRPGVFEIFSDEAQLDRADRASRIVGAPSLADYCRDVILAESDRILAEETERAQEGASADSTPSPATGNPAE